RAHLLRWRPRPGAQRRATTPRARPARAASPLDPSHRSGLPLRASDSNPKLARGGWRDAFYAGFGTGAQACVLRDSRTASRTSWARRPSSSEGDVGSRFFIAVRKRLTRGPIVA